MKLLWHPLLSSALTKLAILLKLVTGITDVNWMETLHEVVQEFCYLGSKIQSTTLFPVPN